MRFALWVWGGLTALAALVIGALLVLGAICVVPNVQGRTLVPGIRRFDTSCFEPEWAMQVYLVLLDWQVGIGLILGFGMLAWAALAKELL